jgi:exportin-T
LLKKTFWNWLGEHLAEKFPYFLKMKLFVLIIVLFKNEYPTEWTTFFEELFGILQSQGTRSIKSFLQICTVLDEEVICHYIQRTPEELAKNSLIKDTMRDNAIPRLLNTWHSIFMSSYRMNPSIAKLCLQLFGLYVSWIDMMLVLRDGFLSALYESFTISELKTTACECLNNIVLKGMKPIDKMDLIEALNIIPFLLNVKVLDDEEFEEEIAKLINSIGLEICVCYEQCSLDEERFRSIAILNNIFPLLLKYLANEYDDTTSALFPFLSNYLLLLKRIRRSNNQGISNDNLRSLLEVLAIKMKYDESEDFKIGVDAGEDEALFLDVRRSLKTHLESICAIDDSLFTACICELVCRIFDSINGNFNNVKWSDAELSIYLLYGFVEAKLASGQPVFLLEDGSLSPLGIMLSKLMETNISKYPHPSIPIIYFEVLNRYSKFFEQRQEYIPQALQSFLDNRGLFHSIKSVRLRVNYLFLRFVKTLRPILGQFTESVLSVIQVLIC